MLDRPDLPLDVIAAHQHLTLLDPSEPPHIFAVLPEMEGCTAKPRHYYGRIAELAPRLGWAQRKGCGVFVAVNAMRGRRTLVSSSVSNMRSDRSRPDRSSDARSRGRPETGIGATLAELDAS